MTGMILFSFGFSVTSLSAETPPTNTPPPPPKEQPKTTTPTPSTENQKGKPVTASYTPLVPGFPQPGVGEKGTDIATYFNFVIKLVIGLTGVFAVLMVVLGGIQYVGTDSWSGKDAGKKRIQAAVGGLILALSSYLILNTIDPSLTYLNFTKGLDPINLPKPLAVGVADTSLVDLVGNEAGSLDPTGQTGGLTPTSQIPTGTTDIDTCAGLAEFRSGGNYSANDKGGTSGAVVGEIAWLMKAVPQKWPGLQVMSSYRSLKWNLTSAYGQSEARADEIIRAFNATDGSYNARVSIASQFGVKKAALTSNHVLGKALDFAGPGLSNGQVDQLQSWARSNSCLSITEIIWQAPGHYDHIHLGV